MLTAESLTALDENEAQALESHLQSCLECRLELDEWQQSVAVLALSTTPLEPSPKLRVRMLESIKTEPDIETKSGNSNGSRTAKVLEFVASYSGKSPSIQKWGAIAASLLFLALLISLVVLWNESNATKHELARLSNQIQQTVQLLTREQEAIAILTAPGARVAELSGTDIVPSTHAILAYDKNGRAILIVRGLPPPPAGKMYQLWFSARGRFLPGKVFTTGYSGEATLNEQVPAEALKASAFSVTVEPENGMRSPTGAVYLRSVP